jgi:hypothetical protein
MGCGNSIPINRLPLSPRQRELLSFSIARDRPSGVSVKLSKRCKRQRPVSLCSVLLQAVVREFETYSIRAGFIDICPPDLSVRGFVSMRTNLLSAHCSVCDRESLEISVADLGNIPSLPIIGQRHPKQEGDAG